VGLNWPIMKFSLRELSPLFFRATTMTGGALLLAAWFTARGHDMRLPRSAWLPLAALAAPNVLGWHLFSILGVQELASGRAAILASRCRSGPPCWRAVLREKPTRRVLLGVACAAVAIALLVAHEVVALAGRPLASPGCSWQRCRGLRHDPDAPHAAGAVDAGDHGVDDALLLGRLLLVAPLVEPWPGWQFSAPMWAALAWGVAINYGVAQVVWFNLARTLPPTASAFSIMRADRRHRLGDRHRRRGAALAGLGGALFVILAIASALLGRPPRNDLAPPDPDRRPRAQRRDRPRRHAAVAAAGGPGVLQAHDDGPPDRHGTQDLGIDRPAASRPAQHRRLAAGRLRCRRAEVAASLDEALRLCAGSAEVFVIGGAQFYAEALPLPTG